MLLDKLTFHSLYLSLKDDLVFDFLSERTTPLEQIGQNTDSVILAKLWFIAIFILLGELKRLLKEFGVALSLDFIVELPSNVVERTWSKVIS